MFKDTPAFSGFSTDDVQKAKEFYSQTLGLDLFFAHEVLPFTRYVPDLPALDANKDRIVLAGGHDSRAHLPYRPAAWLAERFGTQVVDFPGDHAGYATQPAAFAAKLREVLG